MIYPIAVMVAIKSILLGFTGEQMLSLFSIRAIHMIVVMLAPLVTSLQCLVATKGNTRKLDPK
jgi:hypothetical protein